VTLIRTVWLQEATALATHNNANVNDNLTQAKIRKLTVQLEKARYELEGVDPNAMDQRNMQPVQPDPAAVRVSAIEAQLRALREQRRTASSLELQQALDARINALQQSMKNDL